MHQKVDELCEADVLLFLHVMKEKIPILDEKLKALDKARQVDWSCRCPDFCLLHTQFVIRHV